MLSYIKKYPISLFIILTVIYLSFFKPPKTDLNEIPNLDKLQGSCSDVACMGRRIPLSGAFQRLCGITAGILHYLPGWRLVGFCS